MEGKIEVIQNKIAILTVKCSLAARQAETLKTLLDQKNKEVDEGMKELEELYDFLEKQPADDLLTAEKEMIEEITEPEKKTEPKKKRGRTPRLPGKVKTSPEARKEYYHKRYLEKKAKAEAEKNEAAAAEVKTKETAEESEGAEKMSKGKKENEDSIAEINNKARAEGMSYGKYVAKEQIRKQHEEMMLAREKRHLEEALTEAQEASETPTES